MRYNDEIIEEVRRSNDIVDLISGYVKLKRKGNSYFGLCPFHSEKTASFSVSRERQMYYCFGCGEGGNVYTFLMNYERQTFPEAIRFLAERAGITLPELRESEESRREADKKSRLLAVQKEAAKYYYAKLWKPEGEVALRYLRGRALTDETMKHFGLGYADKYSDDLYRYLKKLDYDDALLAESGLFHMDERRGAGDKFWNRVMFPIMDIGNRVIAFGGRVMGEAKPKYLNSPETQIFDKSRNLYGLNFARRSRKKGMLLCEGYMDVITMHQAGYDNAVASLGTALTAGHASILSRYADRVYLLYDSDEAGIRAALRAIPMLRNAGIDARVVDLSPHKDPDEFLKNEGREQFEARLNEAENGFLFEIRMLEREFDLSDPRGKSDFLHAAAAQLLTLDDEIERESHLSALARHYGVEEESVRRSMNKRALKEAGRRPVQPGAPPARRDEPREGCDEQAQRWMIGYLANHTELIGRIAGHLSPDDFPEPFYRNLAELLFAAAKEGEVSQAEILNHLTDAAEQSRAAAVFNMRDPGSEEEEEGDGERAFAEVFFRIKKASLDRRLSEIKMTDLAALQEITEARSALDKLRSEGTIAAIAGSDNEGRVSDG